MFFSSHAPYPFTTVKPGYALVWPPNSITVVLDIDGTLVDTNYQHAIAWHRALRDHGYAVQLWEIHRHIGMGGDQIVAALVGERGERSRRRRDPRRPRARPTAS